MESAAKQGHAPAQRLLSFYFKRGFGTDENLDKSTEWLFKSANQRHPLAALDAGYWCNEQRTGVEPDSEDARKWADETLKWYRVAALNGLPWADIAIAQCYEFGVGVAENKATAYSIYYALANRDGRTFLTRQPDQQGRRYITSRMTTLRGCATTMEQKGKQLLLSWGEDELIIRETPGHLSQPKQPRRESSKRRPR
jgi:hypothetical protein